MSSLAPKLVGDIGGTSARFAIQLASGQALQCTAQYACADFPGLLEAVRHYLAEHRLPAPRQFCVGVAAAITDDGIRFLNNSWSFSRRKLREQLALQRLLVINDFAALAYSLPSLAGEDLALVRPGTAIHDAAKIVVGPGTGLGLAGLVPSPGGAWAVVSGEGGHSTLAATSDEQQAVLQALRRDFPHVSAERVLSGPGLSNLYRATAHVAGLSVPELEPQQVVQAALDGQDPLALNTVRLFQEFLGSFAGNQALAFGARGGVYLGGGVLSRLGPLLDSTLIRQHFAAKGRVAEYLAPMPVWLIAARFPALQGALNALAGEDSGWTASAINQGDVLDEEAVA